jgi:hypothetical protein
LKIHFIYGVVETALELNSGRLISVGKVPESTGTMPTALCKNGEGNKQWSIN